MTVISRLIPTCTKKAAGTPVIKRSVWVPEQGFVNSVVPIFMRRNVTVISLQEKRYRSITPPKSPC